MKRLYRQDCQSEWQRFSAKNYRNKNPHTELGSYFGIEKKEERNYASLLLNIFSISATIESGRYAGKYQGNTVFYIDYRDQGDLLCSNSFRLLCSCKDCLTRK
jgi:hypothetical protein